MQASLALTATDKCHHPYNDLIVVLQLATHLIGIMAQHMHDCVMVIFWSMLAYPVAMVIIYYDSH